MIKMFFGSELEIKVGKWLKTRTIFIPFNFS